MSKPPAAVEVNGRWLKDVQAFMRELEAKIKETGLPKRPGYFSVELPNALEVELKRMIHIFNIDDAIEKAVAEAKAKEQANESDPATGG